MLNGIEPCEFPVLSTAHRQEARETLRHISYATKHKVDIIGFCRKAGIVPSAFLQTAWGLVLFHYTGMHDVCFGYITSGRDALVDKIDTLVGPLANLLISRVNLRDTVRQVLRTTSRRSTQHLAIQHASLAEIQHHLHLSGRRLFNTSLSIIHQGTNGIEGNKRGISFDIQGGGDAHEVCRTQFPWAGRGYRATNNRVFQYDLKFSASFEGDSTDITLEFREPLISQQTAQGVYDTLIKTIDYLLDSDMSADGSDRGVTLNRASTSGMGAHSLSADFFKTMTGTEEAVATSFWKSQFSGIQESHFPALPPSVHHSQPDGEITLTMRGLDVTCGGFEAYTMASAAWSILMARTTCSNESIFGAVISGSQGPALLPFRIMVNSESNINCLLEEVQRQSLAMARYQHMGLERICRLSDEAAVACNFQSLLTVYQSVETGDNPTANTANSNYDKHWQRPGSYAMMIQVRPESTATHLDVKFDSRVISAARASRISHEFEHVLRQLLDMDRRQEKLRDVTVASRRDLDDIWAWNALLPEPVAGCIHDLIIQQADVHPEALAIYAWDGDLTYGQLHELSSKLAHQLISKSVGQGSIVPLCFEKSMWMPVAALAVMKAGGASVAVDTSLPEERVRSITSQVFANMDKPKVILSSVANDDLARQLGADEVFVVANYLLHKHTDYETAPKLPSVRPSDVLYVVFTSGSTGKPKGVVITHQNFCSAIAYQRDALKIDSSSRVFDFASYAFDVVWLNLLKSLTAGACLCIPSAAEREDDLGGSLKKYGATVVDLTPSVARIVEPKSALSNLSTLILGGEAVISSDVNLAGERTQVIVAYGPAECTPSSSILDLTRSRQPGIGRGLGTCTWVVDTENVHILAPVGAVGELWIEGPVVGQGYLCEPEKTAVVFVQDPAWLACGSPGGKQPGRQGRVYRTGDLVRYNEDGTLLFVGRKDTQVKIRGQRVELGDIEHHTQRAIEMVGPWNAQVAAEVVQPRGMASKIIVAFVSLEGSMTSEEHANAVRQATAGVAEELAKVLPLYMLPTIYIQLQKIPMSMARKIDRRRLQDIGSALTVKDVGALTRASENRRTPQAGAERAMQFLWAEILNIDPEGISADDGFFRLGGDSIAAMRLVAMARDKNFNLTVRNVFQYPVLRDLAVADASPVATDYQSSCETAIAMCKQAQHASE
jgi:amino acid adenylation domain-containing protein